ncbi:hypothetical protein M8C21_020432 [Ambrosia artemisiifolia]|uniref:Telomere length regulation protein conserved domain-containing protein n=1 Tax=Ambrosia artemisiifolia TaxID=4212 RepID=A0AAD5BQ05_AMBAR|nr:hypothetical protein M8C21_020432 [Ambrosia artemisiifolia]
MDGGEDTENKNRSEQNTVSEVLNKVGNVIVSINEAKNVDQVISALYSLAVLIFPLDSRAIAGSIDKQYRDEVNMLYSANVIGEEVPSEHERDNWWQDLYLWYNLHVHDRLLAICLLENDGVLQLAREFAHQPRNINLEQHKSAISKVSQLVTSVPDKARMGASTLLSSQEQKSGIKTVMINQLTLEVIWMVLFYLLGMHLRASVGEGLQYLFLWHADVLLSEMVPRIVTQVHSLVQPGSDLTVSEAFKSKPGLQFWSKIMEANKDSYAVERISEQLLHKLATQNINDVEGYWILWLLFHHIFELQSSVRFLSSNHPSVSYIVDLSIKKETESIQFYVMPIRNVYVYRKIFTLEVVPSRLESPSHLVRRMASSIALVFSKVIDPSNPLYLDDNWKEETINWEFTTANADMTGLAVSDSKETNISQDKSSKDAKKQNMNKELMELTLVDPDEVIDPATLNNESTSDVDNDDDDVSETSSESSLQPYDLSDDDTDLKKNFSQLVDVVGALRKSDDADGVERALDVAEKLIRAAPDELPFIASDLVRTLVQVRCSDSTLEGDEESAEEKRQRALVALIVNCPLGSLDPINKLLYSPNVDTSQRIMILDVMTDAALELAHAKTARQKHPTRTQILTTAETQAWFMPSSIGPAGSSIWKEISGTESPLSLTYSYERDLPSKPGQVKRGKTRRWSVRSTNVVQDNQLEWSQNKFPPFAAAFMLPAMQGFDKKSHGVDFLGRDFIVLGKLIHMLGICMKCSAMHPEASALALPLLDMLSTREISHHAEAYVRKSVLFAASCILLALNPTYVASALVEGSSELSRGLEWVRTWALSVAESDTDKECYTMAMACLHLHSEMALQTSRALESSESVIQARGISLPSNLSKGKIRISL